MSKILVAYSTKHGSTREIAQDICDVLQEKGHETTLLDLNNEKKRNWANPDEFNGVIVGSCIRMTKWQKTAKKFISMNKKKFENKPFGLYAVCITAVSDKEKAEKDYLDKLTEQLDISPNISAAIAGSIDLSPESNVSGLIRKAMNAGTEDMSKDMGVEVKPNTKNDFRDATQIRTFTEEFAILL